MKLILHLLGQTCIENNHAIVILPFKKADAIVFYLALEGRRSKEKIKCLFWGDKDERQASGNIRNVIYLLRKFLPHNFYVEQGGLLLRDYALDVDELCASYDGGISPLLFEEPLCGFESLEIPDFNEWLICARRQIREKIIAWLKTRAYVFSNKGMEGARIESLLAILKIDPFDEGTVLELMKMYVTYNQTMKALCIYKEFCKKLQSEAQVLPCAELRHFAEKLSIDTPNKKSGREEFFCGRKNEVRKVLDSAMYQSGRMHLYFIHGEAGVGKTAFVNHVLGLLQSDDMVVFSASPIPIGERFAYSAWKNVVTQMVNLFREAQISLDSQYTAILARYFYDVSHDEYCRGAAPLPQERETLIIAKILGDMALRISRGKRLCLIFEDMHWFDPQSLKLLQIFISELKIPAMIFMTCRPEGAKNLMSIVYNLRPSITYSVLSLQLLPFSKEEIMAFFRVFLSEDIIRSRGETYFVRESSGIPLLLVEMTKILKENANAECRAGLRGLIMGRMEGLTEKEQEVLSILSVFGSPAAPDDLALVAQISLEEISCPIVGLLGRKMIREVEENGDVFVAFSHDNVRECVYESIPKFKRKRIHQEIATVLKRHYSPHRWNPALSGKLRHHYKMAGNDMAVLEQHLQEMSFHINLNHILFPMIQDKVLLKCSLPFSDREETEENFSAVREILSNCRYADRDRVLFKRMEASYLEMYGGYKINWGEYEGGRSLVDAALKLANDYGFDDVALYCMEDIAHQYLQTDKSAELSKCGKDIFDLASKMGKENHKGLAYRLIGMAQLIECNYRQAESIFIESIKVFEALEMAGKFYTLNLLAPRCYIGEMRQWLGESEYAMEQFKYCLDRCKRAGLFWGQSHFHAHIADTALDIGDYRLFREHIREGVLQFERSQGGHCCSILYSLKAVCDAQSGDFKEAIRSLMKADFLAAIGKRSWCAAQLMAKGWVGKLAAESAIVVPGYLEKPWDYYAKAAVKLYEDFGAVRRAERIRKELEL